MQARNKIILTVALAVLSSIAVVAVIGITFSPTPLMALGVIPFFIASIASSIIYLHDQHKNQHLFFSLKKMHIYAEKCFVKGCEQLEAGNDDDALIYLERAVKFHHRKAQYKLGTLLRAYIYDLCQYDLYNSDCFFVRFN